MVNSYSAVVNSYSTFDSNIRHNKKREEEKIDKIMIEKQFKYRRIFTIGISC